MSILLDGLNGITTPSETVQGALTTTGNTILGDATTDTLNVGAGGLVKDASGNVGIGTANPKKRLTVIDATSAATTPGTNPILWIGGGTANVSTLSEIGFTYGTTSAYGETNAPTTIGYQLTSGSGFTKGALTFCTRDVTTDTAPTERMRIDSSGNLLVGTTTASVQKLRIDGAQGGIFVTNDDLNHYSYSALSKSASASTHYVLGVLNSAGSTIGSITHNNTNTAYATSSDYRLKENIEPMTGALNVIQSLKPVTYKWKSTGKTSQGFIAHELQAVVPECVIGEKDAVDDEGNPKYQGIDTSFLVATLTAAIQELKAIVDAQAVRIAALEA
jgi:hypothetical protein